MVLVIVDWPIVAVPEDIGDCNAMDWRCLANLDKAEAVDCTELALADIEILLQNLDDVLLAVALVDDTQIVVAEDLKRPNKRY